jgi:pyrophosphatase PpaX
VRLALKELDATADGALFVGDSPHDIAAGNAAGVATAACLWGPFSELALRHSRPSHWLRSFAELDQLCSGVS